MGIGQSTHTIGRTPDTGQAVRALRARRITIRIIYSLLSIWALIMTSMGLALLVAGNLPPGPYRFAAAGATAFKALTLGGFLVTAWTAGRSVVAVQWVAVGQVAWLLAELIAPQDSTTGIAALALRSVVNTLILLGPWFLLAPERREFAHLRPGPDRVAITIVAALTPLMALWVRHDITLPIPTLNGNSGAELRYDITGLPLAFAAVGLFAALRPHHRRWPLGVVAATSLYVGLDALINPRTDLASPGPLGGLAALAAGSLLAWRAHQPAHAKS